MRGLIPPSPGRNRVKQAKQGKTAPNTLVQSNREMVSSVESLCTHNIHLKIKELWVKRWKIVIQQDLLSNQVGKILRNY